MRRLLWLGAVIGVLLVLSCSTSEKKVLPMDVIGDEEYRVMSAVLKELKAESMQIHDSPVCVNVPEGADSAEIALLWGVKKAKQDSLIGKYGRLYIYVRKDTIHAGEFYDTLIQRFGQAAFYIMRDSVNGKIAYDSLRQKYGSLDYYMTLRDSTVGSSVHESFFDSVTDRRVLTPEFIQSFNTVNNGRAAIEEGRLGDSLVVDLVSERTMEMLHTHKNFWRAFYERYPLSDGIRQLSRVGFNVDTTSAIIYHNRLSGPFGWGGVYLLLAKRGGRWEIVGRGEM